MHIIVQKVRGGFRARLDYEKRWHKTGKTMAEAIGHIIVDGPEMVGIEQISWDKRHTWTQRYLEGKSNRQAARPRSFNVDLLPAVLSPEEARQLQVKELNLPPRLGKLLRRSGVGLGYDTFFAPRVTLGQICLHTKVEIIAAAGPHVHAGKKTYEQLEELLNYYGLALKKG